MKRLKVLYDQDYSKRKRNDYSNSYSKKSLRERLVCSSAINLHNNCRIVDMGNDYLRFEIINPNLKYK